ncbi:O-succinylbenzoic acid--CoA ligase [Lutibacter profundi]|uniref:O-succinylbenzoic acid--CoA ligase n=1 Tax=Lutibacter profundi TaxID=1622118 RepID=A0A0X8G915_9FLAO|nr:O-succinylbenzoic acid--CoA ligase [Lutibacter profundi]
MILEKTSFHKDFKLQGISFSSKEELINFSTKNLNVEVTHFLQQWFNNSLFVEVKTSGSTGKPKDLKLQKNYMVNSAKATGEYFKLPKNTTALLCMSPNYIAGKMMLVRALTLGWQLDVVEPTSKPLENTSKQYDFSAMVPMQLHNSLSELYKIKKLIVGGGVVSNELLNKIQNVNTEVFATYGMTETITHIAIKKLNHFNNVIANETKQSHYNVLPNISISNDSRGCLVINAPNVSEEKIITNDIIELISSTKFNWLGRYDTVINSGGIKLIPEQIEEKIRSVLTSRFFVSGLPDVILGEQLILVVECIDTEMNEEDIFKKIKKLKSVSSYEIPKKIYFLDRFVITETKKINRKETLKMIKSIDL